MGRIIVLGEQVAVAGFALTGATILAAEKPEAFRRAWSARPKDVSVAILTAAAAKELGELVETKQDDMLIITMPL